MHAWHDVSPGKELPRDFVAELMAFVTQPRFCHAHQWRQGDLIIWDNRFLVINRT